MEGYVPQKLRRRRDSTGEIMEACGSRRKKGGQTGARTVAYAAAPSLLGNSERLHPHDQEPRLGVERGAVRRLHHLLLRRASLGGEAGAGASTVEV